MKPITITVTDPQGKRHEFKTTEFQSPQEVQAAFERIHAGSIETLGWKIEKVSEPTPA